MNLRTLHAHLEDTLEAVSRRRDYLLVTRRTRPVAALVNLDLIEDLLAQTSKRYLKSIRAARENYRSGLTHTHRDVFGNVGRS